jgi:hypothetical protein
VKKLVVLLAVVLGFGVSKAEATPLLQLDMKNGTYDPVTESIVAAGGAFTLYALLTPSQNASAADIAALLADTYYVSVAITPQLELSASGLGSFTFGQSGQAAQTVNVTSDMTFGTPPVDVFNQQFDSGDLSKHSVFPTYFSEFAFKFTSVQRATEYNTADAPGGLTPNATGGAYYVAFTGNSSLLASGYNLHFDLYDTALATCAKSATGCGDVDVNSFAPFSHDAQTTTVPEPATMLLMGTGMLGLALRRRLSGSV